MRWRRFLVLSVLAGAALAFGCEDDPNRPPIEADGTGKPINPGGGGGPGVTDGGARDAGDGGSCTTLGPESAVADQVAVAEDPAPGTGGTILDGIYDLLESRSFVGLAGVPGLTGASYQATIRVTGSRVEQAILFKRAGGATTDSREDATLTPSGSVNFTLATTCPSSRQEQFTYSVLNSGNNLTLINLDRRESFSFLRRP